NRPLMGELPIPIVKLYPTGYATGLSHFSHGRWTGAGNWWDWKRCSVIFAFSSTVSLPGSTGLSRGIDETPPAWHRQRASSCNERFVSPGDRTDRIFPFVSDPS